MQVYKLNKILVHDLGRGQAFTGARSVGERQQYLKSFD
jgi:hypothetical protein